MNNNFNPFPRLTSGRLILIKLEDAHVSNIFEYQSNKENFKNVNMKVYTEVDEAKEYMDGSLMDVYYKER